MKILVANLGSTSLKWRLFDFSNGVERVLHKGGLERVIDYCAEHYFREPNYWRPGGNLFFSLFQQFYIFLATVYSEIMFRI